MRKGKKTGKEKFLVIYFLSLSKKKTTTEAGKYLIVGGICTLLDFGILFVLSHFFNINYLLSSALSFIAGTFLNYYLCIAWIFSTRVVANRNVELLYYIIITGIGLFISILAIWIFTEYFKFYFMVSKLFSTGLTYIWNFWARKYFLHTAK